MTTANVPVLELREGMLVDLHKDPYADPSGDNPVFDCEYVMVAGVERETNACVRVDFEGEDSVGFPIDHTLPAVV